VRPEDGDHRGHPCLRAHRGLHGDHRHDPCCAGDFHCDRVRVVLSFGLASAVTPPRLSRLALCRVFSICHLGLRCRRGVGRGGHGFSRRLGRSNDWLHCRRWRHGGGIRLNGFHGLRGCLARSALALGLFLGRGLLVSGLG